MKNAKIILSLALLTIFSLSFALNNSSSNDKKEIKKEAIAKWRIIIPTNG